MKPRLLDSRLDPDQEGERPAGRGFARTRPTWLVIGPALLAAIPGRADLRALRALAARGLAGQTAPAGSAVHWNETDPQSHREHQATANAASANAGNIISQGMPIQSPLPNITITNTLVPIYAAQTGALQKNTAIHASRHVLRAEGDRQAANAATAMTNSASPGCVAT
ncbi:hypothetical protein [Lysobacter capsici]|uniref:hypothetical protein n=1 Tax=Lysobacter capsici TaxID=435897 RepID=UPI00398D4CA8